MKDNLKGGETTHQGHLGFPNVLWTLHLMQQRQCLRYVSLNQTKMKNTEKEVTFPNRLPKSKYNHNEKENHNKELWIKTTK